MPVLMSKAEQRKYHRKLKKKIYEQEMKKALAATKREQRKKGIEEIRKRAREDAELRAKGGLARVTMGLRKAQKTAQKIQKKREEYAKKALFRAEDFVGRYGGEEFLVVMPNTDKKGALEVTTRIQKNFNEIAIKHAYNGNFGIVTVSCGVTSIIPDTTISLKSLIDKTDIAMYNAKNNGRNQIKYID